MLFFLYLVQSTHTSLFYNQTSLGITNHYLQPLDADHSQEFSNSRTAYFPQDLEETKTD